MVISDVTVLARLLEQKKTVIVGKMLSTMRRGLLFSISIKDKLNLFKIVKLLSK